MLLKSVKQSYLHIFPFHTTQQKALTAVSVFISILSVAQCDCCEKYAELSPVKELGERSSLRLYVCVLVVCVHAEGSGMIKQSTSRYSVPSVLPSPAP